MNKGFILAVYDAPAFSAQVPVAIFLEPLKFVTSARWRFPLELSDGLLLG